MNKIAKKKMEKEHRLLETAFSLFISKGIHETTIQDIVDKAGVAKGTFYLYFKDRYDIIQKIIAIKTIKLFEDAIENSRKKEYENFIQQFLYIIDFIIDDLTENQQLLKFIYKNLSLGIHATSENAKQPQAMQVFSQSFFDLFMKRITEDGIILKAPRVTFIMIIELVGSTCYHSILYESPLPIEEYKPHLYEAISKLLSQ